MPKSLLSLMFFASSLGTVTATAMTLEEFLGEVQQRNLSFQSRVGQAEGSTELSREAGLVFSPRFFAEARSGSDGKMQNPSMFVYDKAQTDNYSVGLSQQFRMGLDAKLSYNMSGTELVGADPALLGGSNEFSDATAKLELSLPLWKNGFGRGVRADEAVARQQSLSNAYSSSAQAATLLNDAENTYWRLVAAVEQIKIEEQSVKSAQNILNYVQGQNRKNLGEKSDVLQAAALVESYQLQLEQARNELKSAQRSFNLLLNQDSLAAVPSLGRFDFKSLENLAVPATRPGDRPDVRASAAQSELAIASAEAAAERNKPVLDIYGAYATNGQANQMSDAIERTGKFERDTTYLGIRFSMPLQMADQSAARAGALKNQVAAEQSLRYLKYQQDQNWTDLVQKMSETKQILRLSGMIEEAQREKLENERMRLRQGRTTTYQVLLFEQEYNRAQVARVKVASQILNLQSQAKLYQIASEGGQ